MHITYHAAQRFLERVIKKSRFDKSDIAKAKSFLKREFGSILFPLNAKVPLPSLPFAKAVIKNGAVVTILV